MNATTPTPSLLIGAVLGDASASSMAWSTAIGRMSRRFEEASRGVASPLRLNVVFHVAGTTLPNEFVGVRTGRYSKGQSLLVVQVAVEAVEHPDPEALLPELLADALRNAEGFARRRGIAESLDTLWLLVDPQAETIG